MRKILLILMLLCIVGVSAQKAPSKEVLFKEVENRLGFKDYAGAFVNLQAIESIYGVDKDTRYKNTVICYFTLLEGIEYKEFNTIAAVINRVEADAVYFTENEKRAVNLQYMQTMLNHSLLYYLKFRKQLTTAEITTVKNSIVKNAKMLIPKMKSNQKELEYLLEDINTQNYK
jgi:hypothetical protein